MAEEESLKIQFGDEIHPAKSNVSNAYNRKPSISEKVSINGDLEVARNIADEDRNRRKKQASTISSILILLKCSITKADALIPV
jgi:hypothetical protein